MINGMMNFVYFRMNLRLGLKHLKDRDRKNTLIYNTNRYLKCAKISRFVI